MGNNQCVSRLTQGKIVHNSDRVGISVFVLCQMVGGTQLEIPIPMSLYIDFLEFICVEYL